MSLNTPYPTLTVGTPKPRAAKISFVSILVTASFTVQTYSYNSTAKGICNEPSLTIAPESGAYKKISTVFCFPLSNLSERSIKVIISCTTFTKL